MKSLIACLMICGCLQSHAEGLSWTPDYSLATCSLAAFKHGQGLKPTAALLNKNWSPPVDYNLITQSRHTGS